MPGHGLHSLVRKTKSPQTADLVWVGRWVFDILYIMLSLLNNLHSSDWADQWPHVCGGCSTIEQRSDTNCKADTGQPDNLLDSVRARLSAASEASVVKRNLHTESLLLWTQCFFAFFLQILSNSEAFVCKNPFSPVPSSSRGRGSSGNYWSGGGATEDYGMSQFDLCDVSVHRRTFVAKT